MRPTRRAPASSCQASGDAVDVSARTHEDPAASIPMIVTLAAIPASADVSRSED